MDNTFEYRLLAYLDGMLDARSEREFLKEVSRDAEKKKLLAQYRRLDERLRDRSHPVAVPLRTQQALAQHIPSLQDVIPSAPSAAVTAGRGVSLLAGAGRRIVSLGVIGGMLIGIVAIVRYLPDGNYTPESRLAATTVQSPIDAHESATTAEPATSASRQPGSGVDVISESSLRNSTTGGSRTEMKTLNSTRPMSSDRGTAFEAQAGVAGTYLALAAPATGHTAAVEMEEVSSLPLRPLDGFPANATDTDIRYSHTESLLGDFFAGRVQLYLESGASQFGTAGSADMRDGLITGVYLAGLRYRFSPSFAAGLEFGRSSFARERLESSRSPLASPGGGEIIVVDRALRSAMHPWLRLHGMYTFNPDARLQVEAHAGSGLLLGDDRAMMFSSGFSLVYILGPTLQARAGVHGSGAWLSPAPAAPLLVEPGNGVIGIIRRADAGRDVFTTSLEFRIGFGMLLW